MLENYKQNTILWRQKQARIEVYKLLEKAKKELEDAKEACAAAKELINSLGEKK